MRTATGRPVTWRVHGLSVEGQRHRADGLPCQDAWACHEGTGEDQVTVLAVADGAGSRPRAGEGSRLAAGLAVECFAGQVRQLANGAQVQTYLRTAFRAVRERFLKETGGHADDFATTLTVVVLAAEWIGYASVGDGFVVLRAGTEDGRPQFHLLPQPETLSEYSNETVFLTSQDALGRLVVHCVCDAGIDGLLMSTDGLGQAALMPGEGHGQVANPSFATSVLQALDRAGDDLDKEDGDLAALLRSRTLAATNGDDKTLVRAVRW
jgi:Protein phosphatase 2C